TATVTAGQTATYNLRALTAGVVANVALSCSGAPSMAACNLSQSSANLDGTNPVPFTVTVSTTANSLTPPLDPGRFRMPPVRQILWIWATVLIVLAILLARLRGSPRGLRAGVLATACSAVLVVLFSAGCSSSNGSSRVTGTPKGTHTLVITGTGG